jgi:hypothetical protein
MCEATGGSFEAWLLLLMAYAESNMRAYAGLVEIMTHIGNQVGDCRMEYRVLLFFEQQVHVLVFIRVHIII